MQKVDSFFIPLAPTNGFTSRGNKKQRFIENARAHLPMKYKGIDDGSRYHVDITFHYYCETNHDLDNSLKSVLDAMKCWTIADDRAVKSINARINEQSTKIGVEIDLYRMPGPEQ